MAGRVAMAVGDIFGRVGRALVFWLMALGLLGLVQAEEQSNGNFRQRIGLLLPII